MAENIARWVAGNPFSIASAITMEILGFGDPNPEGIYWMMEKII